MVRLSWLEIYSSWKWVFSLSFIKIKYENYWLRKVNYTVLHNFDLLADGRGYMVNFKASIEDIETLIHSTTMTRPWLGRRIL